MGIGKIPVVGNIVDFLTGKNNLPDGVRSQDIESIDFETYDTGEEIKNTTKTVYEDYSITNQYTDKDGNVITYTLDPSGGRHKEIYMPDGKDAKYDIDRDGNSIFVSGDDSLNVLGLPNNYNDADNAVKVEGGVATIKYTDKDGNTKELSLDDALKIYLNQTKMTTQFDFTNTPFNSIDDVNTYIQNQVDSATTTRNKALAAAMAMISVSLQTGQRIKYGNDYRQNSYKYGIEDEGYGLYFDCSSYVAWLVYQATGKDFTLGYEETPNTPYTGYMGNFAEKNNLYLENRNDASPGDLLLKENGGGLYDHVMMIVGTEKDENGNITYYDVTESNGSDGVKIERHPASEVEDYKIIDMQEYYNSFDKIDDVENTDTNISENKNMHNDHLSYDELFKNFNADNISSINLQKKTNGIEYGIDVSEHNDDIDWNKVKASGIDYAYIRVNYRGYVGGDNIIRDKMAKENVMKAIDAGLDVNLYSFSVPKNTSEAADEANDVLDFINSLPEKYQKKINKIACDHEVYDEYAGNKTRVNGQSNEDHTKNIEAFNKVLNDHDYKTITYASSSDFANSFDSSAVRNDNSSSWVASYEASPENLYSGDYEEWQYTDSGYVSGISTKVDMDVRKK